MSMSMIDTYRTDFRQLDGTLPARLRAARQSAMERFADLGFPSTHLEDWKYTDVAPIAATPFRLANGAPPQVTRQTIAPLQLGVACELVFVNGRFAPTLSTLATLPAGVVVMNLAAASAAVPDLLDAHLGRYAAYEAQSFTALNTAFLRDGALIHVPKGLQLEMPIHLLFLATAGAATVAHPRSLIVAEESSAVTVVESSAGIPDESYLTNAVTEVVVGPNAAVTHYKLQREGAAAFHVATVEAQQAQDSRFHSYVVSLGGALVRTAVNVTLAATGAQCTLDGLYLAGGRQHVDHHTCIDHREPHGTSREVYKGILDGRATGVFNGKVFVRPDAQHSDASQSNKNLLLSDEAVINTKPQLEIFADDVKCSHGATIGRLDEDAIFYLRSRGIDADVARTLLIHAFAAELIGRMPAAAVRARLEEALAARFSDNLQTEVPR